MPPAYGLVFAILAAFSALVAVLASGWSLLPLRVAGAAAALSLLLVAVAYFGAGPRLLFKRADGRHHPLAWLVHWPFFALTAFAYRLAVGGRPGTAYAAVAPNVLLGRRLTSREAVEVTAGLVAVLDLAGELPEAAPMREVKGYRSLPVLDATAMTPGQLRDAVEWLGKHAAAGPVYVHCALGHGRSATVVAAYLIACGHAPDVKSALTSLRALRPGVRLHRPQRKLLDEFASGSHE